MSLVRIHIAEQQRGSYYYQQFPEPPFGNKAPAVTGVGTA